MFTDQEREIFKMPDGTWTDPLVLRRALIRAAGGDLDTLLDAAREPKVPVTPDGQPAAPLPVENPVAVLGRLDAQERLHRVICEAFRLPPFDPATGQGTTEDDSMRVLNGWYAWLAGERNGAGAGPTGSPSTAGPETGPSTTGPSTPSN